MQILDATALRDRMDWPALVDALFEAHARPRPQTGDLLIGVDERAMLVRAGWVSGIGAGIKAVTVYPANPTGDPPRPAVQGQFLLFDDETGAVSAVIDGAELTAWKTAGDSALGARLLAREDAAVLAMVGAGAMAEPLIRAHLAVRPSLERVLVWNRTPARAEDLASRLADTRRDVVAVSDLEQAVQAADIVCCATMSEQPLLRGAWLKPGAHLDLVGAYRPDMREADDEAVARARIFVDFRATAIHDIGELAIPIAAGVIGEGDVLGDFYDLASGTPGRRSADEITLFKNGGGAHLDLMTAAFAVASPGPEPAFPGGPSL